MVTRALLAIEPPTAVIARAIASGLESTGVETMVHGFPNTTPLSADVDLVVLGARASACRASDGQAVRSWLANVRAHRDGQLAAAFEMRLSPVAYLGRGAAYGASRLLSAHGFRLAHLPAYFRAREGAGMPTKELLRAHEWGVHLGVMASSVRRPAFALAPALAAPRGQLR
jgi:uncharacterized protein (DUF1684 family)